MPAATAITPEHRAASKLLAEGFVQLNVNGLTPAVASNLARRLVTLTVPQPIKHARQLPVECTRAIRLTDAATELGISREQAYQWLSAGRLRRPINRKTKEVIEKINGLSVVTRESVDQCLSDIS